ncbi:hypothetical protein FHEFKHOI_00573 [Candidatus Methanoperedenaceae archaeon GB50]|nr:hypothetical protein AIOGIFDO_00571 [Candidatus Methanoperedenaceae archaeon GB37]CAD7769306.1 hypothetical protein FHEFKHOI_00573 [Candidatus Methanoperedenaceae archaeon GB50]
MISISAASNNYYGIYLNRSNNNILTENTPSKTICTAFVWLIRAATSSGTISFQAITAALFFYTLLLITGSSTMMLQIAFKASLCTLPATITWSVAIPLQTIGSVAYT